MRTLLALASALALTASAEANCQYIELHTGSYANAAPNEIERELERLEAELELLRRESERLGQRVAAELRKGFSRQ